MPNRKLKTTDARLKLIEEKIGTGTWTWDLETGELIWSAGLCRILGVDPHDIVPTIDLYQSLVHPDDQIDFDDAIGVVSSRKLENRKFRIIRPDGVLRCLQSRAEPHFDRNGKTVLLIGVITDVTDDEAFRAEFEVQKQTANVLTRLLEGWVWRAHPDGKLIETAHWMKLTGQTPGEAHDWERLSAIHPEDRDGFREAWRNASANRTELEMTIRVKLLDGSYQQRRSRAYPVLNGDGSIRYWIGHSVVVPEKAPTCPGKSHDSALLTASQIRAARALLDITGPELAERSGVSFSTIRRMEQNASSVREESLVRVRMTFEVLGITFTHDGDRTTLSFEEPLIGRSQNRTIGAAQPAPVENARALSR